MKYRGTLIAFQAENVISSRSQIVVYNMVGPAEFTDTELTFLVKEKRVECPHWAAFDGKGWYRGYYGYRNAPPYKERDDKLKFALERLQDKQDFLRHLRAEGAKAINAASLEPLVSGI